MEYRNIKTGFVLNSDSVINGEDWELLSSSPKNTEKEEKPKKTTKRTKET